MDPGFTPSSSGRNSPTLRHPYLGRKVRMPNGATAPRIIIHPASMPESTPENSQNLREEEEEEERIAAVAAARVQAAKNSLKYNGLTGNIGKEKEKLDKILAKNAESRKPKGVLGILGFGGRRKYGKTRKQRKTRKGSRKSKGTRR